MRANAFAFFVDNPKLFKFKHGRMDALAGAFQQRFVLRVLQRRSEDYGHFIYDSTADRTVIVGRHEKRVLKRFGGWTAFRVDPKV
jgi:hypothetical protein